MNKQHKQYILDQMVAFSHKIMSNNIRAQHNQLRISHLDFMTTDDDYYCDFEIIQNGKLKPQFSVGDILSINIMYQQHDGADTVDLFVIDFLKLKINDQDLTKDSFLEMINSFDIYQKKNK